LRLSDMQNQRSWLGRITRPFPRDNNDWMKPKEKKKQWNKYQIQAVLIEYLKQFIERTALPAIQKYEQLQRKYCKEKKEWTEKVEFLERQNSVLTSKLGNADRSYGDVEQESNNFKKFHSPNQRSMKGNLLHDPDCKEIRQKTNFNLVALPMSNLKPSPSFWPECARKKGEFIDFKMGYCRQVNDFELERIDAVNKSQICHEDFPNMKEKLDEADKLNLERKLWENHSFYKLDQMNPTKGTFVVQASRNHGGYARGRSKVQKGAKESASIKLSCVTQDMGRMKEKTLGKTISIDQQVLAVSDSWDLQKKDWEPGTLNNRSLKVNNERRLANSQKICQVKTSQGFDSRNQFRMSKRRVNKCVSGSPIRSKWL